MALAWNAGWVNSPRGSNPASSALGRGATTDLSPTHAKFDGRPQMAPEEGA